MEEELEI